MFVEMICHFKEIQFVAEKKSIIQDDASVAPSEASDSRPFALEGIEIQFGGNLDKRYRNYSSHAC